MKSIESHETVFWIALVLITTIDGSDPVTISLKNRKAEIDIASSITLRIYHSGEPVYKAVIGKWMPMVGHPEWSVSDNEFVSQWENGLHLNISGTNDGFPGIYVQWTAPETVISLEDCCELGENNWYGGSERRIQAWPIHTNPIWPSAFVTSNVTGGVLERYFLASGGFAYYLDPTVPLFVSLTTMGNRSLCFRSSFEPPYINTNGRLLQLTYHIIVGSDLLDVHHKVAQKFLAKPTSIPSVKMMTLPIWSTWDVFTRYINQTKVLQLARDIRQHGFPIGQIEIDEGWESCYGDETFDLEKFPNPIGMVNSLKLDGIDVTLWVHPFVNNDCDRFHEGSTDHYFISNYSFNETMVLTWWNGNAAVIDVTNPNALQWWAGNLNRIQQEVGVASFKFDYGDDDYLPQNGYYHSAEDLQPGIFATNYATFASQFGSQVEVHVGYRTQQLPIFVRMADRQSTWDLESGLKSVITSALHFGIVGYPFVLPDMIAGNGYGIEPTRELFIRWVQVAAFMPAMQFSFLPWNFDPEVTSIALRMVALHQNISDVLVTAARQSTVDGSPIIRPVWWMSPNDTTAQVVDDEFLVGDTYLVAPIVSEGQTTRDIYLPEATWRDELSRRIISGPIWLRNYPVALKDIPYFTKLDN